MYTRLSSNEEIWQALCECENSYDDPATLHKLHKIAKEKLGAEINRALNDHGLEFFDSLPPMYF